jgi:hypothetical protein
VIDGLSAPFDRDVFGIDAVQALENALIGAGKFLAGSPEFRAGQIVQWDKPVKEETALFLPLPMHSLQSAPLVAQLHARDRARSGDARRAPADRAEAPTAAA